MTNTVFHNDDPIKSIKEDKLDRVQFATGIAQSITAYSSMDSLCIGIYGPWGSGKTSVLNMITSLLENDTQGKESPIIIRFNPWNFSSANQLIYQFFMLLSDRFGSIKDKRLNKVVTLFEEYGIGLLDFVPYGAEIKAASNGCIKFFKKKHSNSNDLAGLKTEITEILRSQKKKIVITIDDIDRLPDDQIRQVFQLVAATADFPNTIYLLSYDKAVVVKALNKTQQDEGIRYLNKIIQVAIRIPPIAIEQKSKLFSDEFVPFLEMNKLKDKFEKQIDHWWRISDDLFSLIENLRDIKRLKNCVEIKYKIIGNEVNFTDLVAISLIEDKYPGLYMWIYSHKDMLVQSEAYSFESMLKDNEAVSKRISDEIKSIVNEQSKNDQTVLTRILLELFPNCARAMNVSGNNENSDSLLHNQRIGHPDKFDRYFIFSLEKNEISEAQISALINYSDEDESTKVISDAFKSGKGIAIYNEINAGLSELNSERSKILISAIINSMPAIVETDNDSGYSSLFFSIDYAIAYLLYKLFLKLNSEQECHRLIKAHIVNANYSELYILNEILRFENISLKNIQYSGSTEYKSFLMKKSLDELNSEFYSRFLILDNQSNILNEKIKYYRIYLFIRDIYPEKYKKWISNKFEDELNILRYIAVMWVSAGTMYAGGESISILLLANHSEDGLDQAQVDAMLDRHIKDKSIENISFEYLVRLAGYYKIKHKSDTDFENNVPENRCIELAEKWSGNNRNERLQRDIQL